MSDAPLSVRDIDLSVTHVDAWQIGTTALTVFWWRALPLGMVAASADELPFSAGSLRQHLIRFAAEQRLSRDATLGAPLQAGSEGVVRRCATIVEAGGASETLSWLDDNAAPANGLADTLAVVICTRDRGEALAGCLDSIARQRRPAGETIVVDNSVDGNAHSVCQRFPQVIYVHEPSPGLSYARNAGLRACSRNLIAFTDDDVVVDANWTAEIVAAFARTDADAVTGLVLPLRLNTSAQCAFQFAIGGFGSSFVPAIFGQAFFAETLAAGAHVWRIGAGANMAFRRSVFERVGLFDTRLGAGASGCSEDSELWYRLLAAGGSILYEPRAVVRHDHRADWPGLLSQMRAYMRGHVAALIVQGDTFNHRGNMRRIFYQLPRYFVTTALRSVLDNTPERRRILWHEIVGWAAGLGYLSSPGWRRQRVDRLDAPAANANWRSAA